MAFYGQLITGAPGAGKSTYCAGLLQIMKKLKRPVICINLDPANDVLQFPVDIDIRELITVDDAMLKLNLGPNGATRYCMKTLAKNIQWLKYRVKQFNSRRPYLLIDMPGQLELYNSDGSIAEIVDHFRRWEWRVCSVYLSDSLYASDPGKFISVVLSALAAMINLEVAQVNVLSKVDMIQPDTSFNLDFFERLPDLKHLVRLLDDHPMLSKYKKFNQELCDVIDSYNLVSFVPLDVQSKERMLNLLKIADNANGFNIANASDLRDIVLKP